MRFPQIVIRESDGWVARQLRQAADEHRWLLREPRSPADALTLARDRRPTVLVVQVEPTADDPTPFALLADVHCFCPEVPVIALSDTKLPDADRVVWTALLLDLGAKFVLFPPLAKPVLEDAVTGLMTAAIRRGLPGSVET